MNYDNYFVDSENVMTLEDIAMYARNKDFAYMLMKKQNSNGEDTFCLKKVVIVSIHNIGFLDDETEATGKRISVITLDDELHKHLPLEFMGDKFVLLKSKPGEEYIKLSVDNLVVQGRYCKDCKYCSNFKMFTDEYFHKHDASCLLFLTYLDFDKEIGEMYKCEKCKQITG